MYAWIECDETEAGVCFTFADILLGKGEVAAEEIWDI